MNKTKVYKNSKRKFALLSLFIIFSLFFTIALAESINEDNIILKSGETLEKTSFLSGKNIRVDGDINATAFITGGNVEINGNVDGDLFAAGQNITINGNISGSLFTASQNIIINGVVENNIYLAGAILKVNSKTEGSAFLAGQNIFIEDGAIIEKDAFVGGSNVNQSGIIIGDLSSSSQSLFVGGKVGGDLIYSSQNKADFSNDSEILGKTNWKKTDYEPELESSPTKKAFTSFSIYKIFFSVLTLLAVWFFTKLISPTIWDNLGKNISIAPLKTIGFGFSTLLLTPIIIIILLFTVVGIPLSFILLLSYIILIYISKIIVASLIGIWFQEKYNLSKGQKVGIFLLSLIMLSLLKGIPIFGWIISLSIASLGIGSIFIKERNLIVHQ